MPFEIIAEPAGKGYRLLQIKNNSGNLMDYSHKKFLQIMDEVNPAFAQTISKIFSAKK